MGAIENVLRINPNALDARGNLKSFTEQYGEYALARELDPRSVDRHTPFVLSMDSGVLGVPGLAGRPLLLSNTSLKHIQLKHIQLKHGARSEIGRSPQRPPQRGRMPARKSARKPGADSTPSRAKLGPVGR